MKAPLDSRQVRAFSVLARTGSFTQTARELHITQSAISHSIKALERDVGCRLLDRLGKKVVLTQAGEQLLQHATKILVEMEQARESLGHLGKWGRGRLRILRRHHLARAAPVGPEVHDHGQFGAAHVALERAVVERERLGREQQRAALAALRAVVQAVFGDAVAGCAMGANELHGLLS